MHAVLYLECRAGGGGAGAGFRPSTAPEQHVVCPDARCSGRMAPFISSSSPSTGVVQQGVERK